MVNLQGGEPIQEEKGTPVGNFAILGRRVIMLVAMEDNVKSEIEDKEK